MDRETRKELKETHREVVCEMAGRDKQRQFVRERQETRTDMYGGCVH